MMMDMEIQNGVQTPLHDAVQQENTYEIARLLADGAYDVNARNDWGETPLHIALTTRRARDRNNVNSIATVKQLLDAGADVNVSKINSNGKFTTLFLAIDTRNIHIIGLLIEAGADIDERSSDDYNPLILAMEDDSVEIVRFLVEKGASVDVANGWGESPLCYIAGRRPENLEMVKLLLNRGADVYFEKDSKGPVLAAAVSNNFETLKILAEHFVPDREDDTNRICSEILRSGLIKDAKRRFFLKLCIERIAVRKVLCLLIDLDEYDIDSKMELLGEYFALCEYELLKAKKTMFRDSWVTLFHLLVDEKSNLIKYAANATLMQDYKNLNLEEEFPIYGERIKRKMEDAMAVRASKDGAAKILNECMPIFNGFPFATRLIADQMDEEDRQFLCRAIEN